MSGRNARENAAREPVRNVFADIAAGPREPLLAACARLATEQVVKARTELSRRLALVPQCLLAEIAAHFRKQALLTQPAGLTQVRVAGCLRLAGEIGASISPTNHWLADEPAGIDGLRRLNARAGAAAVEEPR